MSHTYICNISNVLICKVTELTISTIIQICESINIILRDFFDLKSVFYKYK